MKKLIACLFGLILSISSAFADLDPCRNMIDMTASNIDVGHYISSAGVYSESGNNFLYRPYISVQPNTTYTLSWGNSELYYITISEYTTADDAGFVIRNTGTTGGNYKLTITTGAETHYVRFGSNPYGNSNTVTLEQITAFDWQFEQGDTPTTYTPYDASCHTTTCANLFDPATTTDGYIDDSGVIHSSNTYKYSALIPVVVGKTYTWSGTNNSSTAVNKRLHGYDSNGNWVEQLQVVNVKNAPYSVTATIPNGVAFVRLSGIRTDTPDTNVQIEEGSTATAYCVPESSSSSSIKIATTKYNAARFDPLVQTLNSAIAKIKTVVSTTIEQTKAVASLQANKQRRPNDNEECPAGKKCLLVEDSNGIPHWYEIVESYYNPTLPAGFTELAYLESTGTQYIDTGVVAPNGFKVDTTVVFTEIQSSGSIFIMGAHNASTPYGRNFVGIANANKNFTIGAGGYVLNPPTVLAEVNTSYHLVADTFDGIHKMVINGIEYTLNLQDETSLRSSNSLYLFFEHGYTSATSNKFIGKMYVTKIWDDNGALVRDFIPARRESDGVLGMYDLADSNPATAFHTNQGTGTFTAGPVVLPDGFTTLEYLTSGTDGQYIDTGILFDPTKNFRVVGSVINPDATLRKIILGNYYSQQSETYYSIELYNDGKFRNYMSADGGSAFNIYSPTAVPADTIAYFDTSYDALAHQTTTTLRYGTTEQTYSGATPETTTVAVHTLKLFNDKRNLSPVYNKPVSIGAVQIYIDGLLVRNFVPAKQGNIVGMFDLANGQFYSGQGGNFTAGPVAQ